MIEISTLIITAFYFKRNCCSQECWTTTKINLLFASFILQFTTSMRGFKVQLAPPVGISFTFPQCPPGYQPHPEILTSLLFYLAPLKIIINLSEPHFYEQGSFKILENLTPPLKCTLVQKSNTHFLKKQKILFSTLKNLNIFEC